MLLGDPPGLYELAKLSMPPISIVGVVMVAPAETVSKVSSDLLTVVVLLMAVSNYVLAGIDRSRRRGRLQLADGMLLCIPRGF